MNFDYDLAVRNARVLVEQTRNAGWELARICSEVTEAGIPARTFAEDVGISRASVEKLVRTWDRYAYRMHEKRSFAEFFVMASTTKERAERLEAVAESGGISVSTARNRNLVPSARRSGQTSWRSSWPFGSGSFGPRRRRRWPPSTCTTSARSRAWRRRSGTPPASSSTR
jgi:hypothetical protein